MTTNRETLKIELKNILAKIQNAHQPKLNQKLKNDVSSNLTSLLNDITQNLHITNDLSPWAKEHLIEATTCLYWGWLHAAQTELSLALTPPNETAHDNKYKKEIETLPFEEITKRIEALKKFHASQE